MSTSIDSSLRAQRGNPLPARGPVLTGAGWSAFIVALIVVCAVAPALNLLVRPDYRGDFQLDGRTRRPPRDRMNALVSFLYSMLMNDCRSAIESVGLDPQLGFLHAVRPGRAALALDLMEEFRAYLADRLALSLINRGQIRPNDFALREGGAVQLEGDGRRTVVVAYQERKQEEITHPLLEQKMRLGLVPLLQARFIARVLRADMQAYVPFLIR